MKSYEFMNIAIILFLMIIFSLGAYYLATNFERNINNSKEKILKDRLKDYIEQGYHIKTWQSTEFLIKNERCPTCEALTNMKKCKEVCLEYLNATEYTPVDAFVIKENNNKGTCYCIFS